MDFVEKGKTHLIGPMAKGFAGQIGGNAVENDVPTGGTRRYVIIATIEGYTRHFLLMVLMIVEHLKSMRSSMIHRCVQTGLVGFFLFVFLKAHLVVETLTKPPCSHSYLTMLFYKDFCGF